jgi:putative redox protein
MALPAHGLWWQATLTALTHSMGVPAHRCSRSVAPTAGGSAAAGANPYELLSASLAACTAMTIRLQARRRKILLSHVEVAVSHHHGEDGGRDSFERSITLEGKLVDNERAQLMQAANMCPVGRTLGLSAYIRTNDNLSVGRAASYDDDLNELPIPNVDPD